MPEGLPRRSAVELDDLVKGRGDALERGEEDQYLDAGGPHYRTDVAHYRAEERIDLLYPGGQRTENAHVSDAVLEEIRHYRTGEYYRYKEYNSESGPAREVLLKKHCHEERERNDNRHLDKRHSEGFEHRFADCGILNDLDVVVEADVSIPLIRGPYVSRPFDSIIEEAKKLASEGYKELIVLEQDTTRYGLDLKEKKTIVNLLKELLKVQGLEYIRLLYLYPDEITDELIELIATEERLTPYFDIPIQHSEDKILNAMNRRGDKAYLKELFAKIRNRIPNAILRTTIMVGFPGETKEDFENLLDFVKEIKFDHLGAFKYSREEGTKSHDFPHQVRESTKQKRLDELMELQQGISYNQNKKHIGEAMEGLVVGKDKGSYLLRSYYNAPDDIDGKIYFSSNRPLKEGEKVKVLIKESYVYDLYGTLIE